MKRLFLPARVALGWILFACLIRPATADVVQLDQNAVLYAPGYAHGVNNSSLRGAPGKTLDTTLGSDGRAPAGGTPYQFQGAVVYGAIVVPKNGVSLTTGKSYEQLASSLNLPRGTVNNMTTIVLRTAQVGAPTFAQAVSFAFGSVIAPPSTDEGGIVLTNVAATTYWSPEPVAPQDAASAGYYYSPHARQVFATKAGPIQVTWRKGDPAAGTLATTNKVTIGGLDYITTNVSYVASGAPAKTPRRFYWTEKSYAATGKPVSVPAASVGMVNFVHNPAFPRTVATEFDDGGVHVGAGTTNSGLAELRTIWHDASQGLIFAYNVEGRVFMELLGDIRPDGTRNFLGFEIVDVSRQPAAQVITSYLGEKLTAYADGHPDGGLEPSPLMSTLQGNFLYMATTGGGDRREYYSAALTANPNDVLVHWLEAGLVGLRWPAVYNSYAQVWPSDPSLYSHYLRPPVASVQEAGATAVQLSANNNPVLQFQDPMDSPRAFLDERSRFYTYLDAGHPQHRSLLRYSSGNRVAFERVLSSLSTTLQRGTATDVTGVVSRPDRQSTLVLDGTGYGQLPDGVYFSGGSYTIESWVNVTEARGGARLLDFGTGAGTNNVVLALAVTNAGPMGASHYTNGVAKTVNATGALPVGQWVHVASVFDGTTSTLTVYVNGVASASGTVMAPQNSSRTSNLVGKSNGSTDPLAKAQLDGLRIWTTARSASDLAKDMLAGSYAPGTPGLLAQFNFDEVGQIAYDSSGNSNHMTLYGGATSSSGALAAGSTPRYVSQTAYVGDRIQPPVGELGNDGTYLAGYVLQSSGVSFNPWAYKDPFVSGFDAAGLGAIIPVNAIPGANTLEVWWFRKNATNAVRNPANGFEPVYWPAVIGHYSLAWPDNPTNQIILASNAGSGAMTSLQAKGTIYTQNDPTQLGYNPNEEHALMLGGQAYALRDDLNVTSGSGFSSMPYVLLDYTEADGRPAMRAFRVQRENAARGIFFDYVVEAGKQLQAPMPLPLLPPPLATVTNVSGGHTTLYVTNYNGETLGTAGDFPTGWSASEAGGPFAGYRKFTYRDRKDGFWVMRGQHAGLPTLEAGAYASASGTFTNSVTGGGTVNVPTTNYIHTSRRGDSLVASVAMSTPLPDEVKFGPLGSGLAVYGTWRVANAGPYQLTITDGDGSQAVVSFSFSSAKNAQGPLVLNGFTGRPPQLAQAATSTNSFSMTFYYATQDGFAWPNNANPPVTGTIVPYLRPVANGIYSGSGDSPKAAAQPIVYRPTWPGNTLPVAFGETLTVPSHDRPAIRGQTSAGIVYQQSIALASTNRQDYPSVILHDPTRQKSFELKKRATDGLAALPAGVRVQSYQGKLFFPNLPPHLANRFYFDPGASARGSLLYKGQFKDELTGEKYLQLNVLGSADLATLQGLCPGSDPDKRKWDDAIAGLTASVDTLHENPAVPGQYVVDPNQNVLRGPADLVTITNMNTPVDSYALSAAGPGQGYFTVVVGDGAGLTPAAEPVSMYVMRVTGKLYVGEVKVLPSENPLSELVTFEHTADLAGRTADYEYEWKYAPPVDGFPPATDAIMSRYQALVGGLDLKRYTLGSSGILGLSDNWLVVRYRPKNPGHPFYNQWSAWSAPQLAEGYVKRVLAGINPFNQRTSDLQNNTVNTGASLLMQAGRRYEGDVALNQSLLNSYGLIEIYETVLNRARNLSINAGIDYGPANDALLLAAGYLSDLYRILGDEAFDDASNPTIGMGTKDKTYGDIATSLFSFKGQLPTLLDEELALLLGRDDVALPGVQTAPVYNRLVWNYTGGIDSGQAVYALNYNIVDQNQDGRADATDAALMFPQGHGDAYGHYLTALKGYYSLLMNPSFEWVPRVEAVQVLGAPVTVSYQNERKFAAAAASVARTGRQVFDLTWRKYYAPGADSSWAAFSTNRVSSRTVKDGTNVVSIVREWGLDQWASRVGQGDLVHWVIANAILPDVDPDPSHEGIQKVDRTTVLELNELTTSVIDLQTAMDNAEGRLSPLGITPGAVAFDMNPAQVVGADPKTHFEQVYDRALLSLNNAVAAFDDAKDVTRLMRSEGDSLDELRAQQLRQELAFTNALIELYGMPYPDDTGPGKTYVQGYAGPDLFHYMYVETPELTFPGILDPTQPVTFRIDVQHLPEGWVRGLESKPEAFDFVRFSEDGEGVEAADGGDAEVKDRRSSTNYVEYTLEPHGYFGKPAAWTSKRHSKGQLQSAIAEVIEARASLRQVLQDTKNLKEELDGEIRTYKSGTLAKEAIDQAEHNNEAAKIAAEVVMRASDIYAEVLKNSGEAAHEVADAAAESLPKSIVVGTSTGGDETSPGRASIHAAEAVGHKAVHDTATAYKILANIYKTLTESGIVQSEFAYIRPTELREERKRQVSELQSTLERLQMKTFDINHAVQRYSTARTTVDALAAKGERILQEREVARQRLAALITGFSTRDAAFRMFRDEKLERYKTLFDLASRYALLAANAYDYETGLLGTPAGQAFVNRIVNSRALGVVQGGIPQFAGSNTGDPGLSSALAEMKADFDVLKGRLGFNSPDVYKTIASIRTGNLRILPDASGRSAWQDYLQRSTVDNILDDADVRRYCQQADRGDGSAVPGLVLTFSTSINPGANVFGLPLAAGDAAFHRSSFATKLNSVGVILEGYRGMNVPGANHTSDPNLAYLDPQALSANPYVYLIPVGLDTLRTPPLGDATGVRQWKVDDLAIPLPFNIGQSGFSSKAFYQSADSLTEPLFSVRKHQAFRPVDSVDLFSQSAYLGTGLQFSEFSNRRLIGRSVWNSQWKLVIPADSLLANPREGLSRLLQTLTDIKLQFTTYSYSGN